MTFVNCYSDELKEACSGWKRVAVAWDRAGLSRTEQVCRGQSRLVEVLCVTWHDKVD